MNILIRAAPNVPTFNFDFCRGKPYHAKETQSKMGVLSENLEKFQFEIEHGIQFIHFHCMEISKRNTFKKNIKHLEMNQCLTFK